MIAETKYLKEQSHTEKVENFTCTWLVSTIYSGN